MASGRRNYIFAEGMESDLSRFGTFYIFDIVELCLCLSSEAAVTFKEILTKVYRPKKVHYLLSIV